MKQMNWGRGIVLALALFMSLMVFMVYKAVNQRFDLVAEDYYSDEIAYQEVMDKENNLRTLKGKMQFSQTNEGLLISFPQDFENQSISGTVTLYRPSDARLDKSFDLEIDVLHYIIPNESLSAGKWEVKVDWTVSGIDYYFKEQIIL